MEIFAEMAPQDFVCPICELVMKNPNQCTNGHLFCLDCLHEWLRIREECPTCKCLVTQNGSGKPSQNLFARNVIGKLQCRCSLGCAWTGTLEELQSHIHNDCVEEIVLCPNVDCTSINEAQIFIGA